MIWYTKFMQQLWFIDKPMTQYVSGTNVPIFRGARLYICFSAFKVLAGVFERRQARRGQCVEAASLIYAFNVGWENKNALLLDVRQPLMFLFQMMYLKNKCLPFTPLGLVLAGFAIFMKINFIFSFKLLDLLAT